MKARIQFIIVLLVVLIGPHIRLSAQPKDTISVPATIKGAVWDSARNHALQDATVAIYSRQDSTLLQFCVTDIYGAFQIKRLPANVPMYILVTFTGFELLSKNVAQMKPGEDRDLGTITILKADQLLKEVVITSVVPVRVNKDTIEFNARAFNLDSSAVVEDLMRRLPGMTVWGDGSIILNGREIKSLTVNGKPFFGKSFKVATQNIPKTAVDKIQVFNQINREDPLDTLTHMNIKLLKGGERGYFGKIGAGGGTDNRFQLDGIMSFFNARNQLSFGGAYNNINKIANNMTTLLENGAFKSLAANIDYQPNFRMEGINRSSVAGAAYRHNLSDKIDYNHNNAITLDYFTKNQNIEDERNTKSLYYIDEHTELDRTSSKMQIQDVTSHDLTTSYNFLEPARELEIRPFLSHQTVRKTSSNLESSATNGVLQGANSSLNQSKIRSAQQGIKLLYRNTNNFDGYGKRNIRDFKVSYEFFRRADKEERRTNTDFQSAVNTSKILLNRNYQNNENETNHSLGFEIDNINRILFGARSMNVLTLNLKENLQISGLTSQAIVADYDSVTQKFKGNAYLSNHTEYRNADNKLSLIVSRRLLSEVLSGRFRKTANVSFEVLGQSFYQKNKSQKSFQNIRQNYFNVLPQLYFTFDHSKFNYINRTLDVRYSTAMEYPTTNQLAPLLDSSSIWALDAGNPDLSPSTNRQIKISFLKSYDSDQNYRYQVAILGGVTKDKMVDSTVFDDSGKSIHYIVNSKGYRYMGAQGSIRTARKIELNQIQMSLNAMANYVHTPGFVNSRFVYSNVFITNNDASVLYTFKDKIALNLKQGVSIYQSTQEENSNSKFKNLVYNTSFAGSTTFNKNISLNTDVTYSRSKASSMQPINFLLWNAHAICRFSKRNNMEIKVSAMDLLRQNRGLVNLGTATTITTGTTKVLRQYFMLSVAYYPRKFGK